MIIDVNFLSVTFGQDTLSSGDTTAVCVQLKDSDGNDIEPEDGDFLVQFSLDSDEGYGELIGYDTTGVAYTYAHSGGVRYVANGVESYTITNVQVTAYAADAPQVKGAGALYVVPAPKIVIIDKTMQEIGQVKIALWDNAYNSDGTLLDDFITLDTRCFYVLLTDYYSNVDKSNLDQVMVTIQTESPDPWESDAPHSITLLEIGEDTGVFLSESQLLMSPDLDNVSSIQTDDQYPVISNYLGTFAIDNSPEDRTHKCYPGGKVIAKYASSSGELRAEVSVPLEKVVNIECYVMIEPFRDKGYDDDGDPSTPVIGAGNGIFDYEGRELGEPFAPGKKSEKYRDLSAGIREFHYGDDQDIILNGDGRGPVVSAEKINKYIKRAQIGWAQAGIKINNVNIVNLACNSDPATEDILYDGRFNRIDDAALCYKYHKDKYITSQNVAYVFFTGKFDNAKKAGTSWRPGKRDYNHYICFLDSRQYAELKTMAHELGHLLTGMEDAGYTNPAYFFPRESVTGYDVTVEVGRRLPAEAVIKALENEDL